MEEEPEKCVFESREYQTELFEQAVDNNIILYLPTGSGKTYIATMLIKHFNGSTDMISLENGGKRTFFLVNTVALVEQQSNQIKLHAPLLVGSYSGDMGVDLWPPSVWINEFNTHHVMVMTCQIFVDLINFNVITLRNVNLVIFDECHRGVSNHPMRQAMMTFKDVPPSDQPRVLGLTATLLNGNVSANQVAAQVKELEKTYLAKVSTSVNEEMVKMYSTNPIESRVSFMENDITGYCYKLRDEILDQLNMFVTAVKVDEVSLPDTTPLDSKLIDASSKKTNKRLKNLIEDIKANMDDLGVYGGSLAVLAHLVQMQQLLPNCQMESTRLLYQSITTDCTLLRKYFDIEMKKNGLSEYESLYNFSSDKVRKLLAILKKLKKGDSAIVFVKRRFSAKVLFYLLKKASEIDANLNHVKSNFIVGYNVGNPLKDTRENYLQRRQNKNVMNMFNQGELNVLFASNVVEEGIDITQCNFVIMFDAPIDFRSYIQSKGRARDQNSNYIIMIKQNDTSFENRYNGYCHVEKVLKDLLYGGKTQFRQVPTKEELEKSIFLETPGLEPYKPLGPNGPVVTCISAISLVNRYFASLKSDKFTKVSPFWWLQQKQNKYKCFLQLPMESSVSGIIEGSLQASKENAKRSVALEACRQLYESGELGKISLLPITPDDTTLNVKSFTPNVNNTEKFEEMVEDKKVKIGTKRYKRLFEKKFPDCLNNCRPQPNERSYLHVIVTRPNYTPPPNNNRLEVIHEILSMANSFALISSKELPKIANFPLYMSTGELEATVEGSYPIYLTENEMKLIDDFHYTLFNNVLELIKDFVVKDNSHSQNSFMIAPVKLSEKQQFMIDWDTIKEANKPFPSTDKQPSAAERIALKITDENYLLKVVSPWYRNTPSQKYLITKVCHDMSENSVFPTETYSTYKEYFQDKYKLKPLVSNQPLIEVKALSSRLNCTKPRSLTKVLRRKNKEENEDFEVWLMPELCVVYPLDGKYWLKAQLLPSVLYRITRLCIAEEVRSKISMDAGLGPLALPQGKNWNKLEEDISLQKKDDEPDYLQQALKPLSIMSATLTSKSPDNAWGADEEEPMDIERNMDVCSVFDIINHKTFVEKPLLGLKPAVKPAQRMSMVNLTSDTQSLKMLLNEPQKIVRQRITPPKLKMLEDISDLGPEQVEVMQALTVATANDFVNCERLETLGDSFLKLVISLMLFDSQPNSAEGFLTHIKGSVVGNKNLFFCGKNKNLGSILQVQDFAPKEEWVAPGFCVDHRITSVICTVKLDPDVLYAIKIPDSEKRSGVLSEDSMNKVNDILLEADDGIRKSSAFINQQALTDKNVADAVEALLGVYLKTCGIFGALKVLNWFGVTNPNLSTPNIFTSKAPTPAKGEGNPNVHLQQPQFLESILGYTFKNRAYMLQAVSHPSYTRNNITPCYQRLEFLGDALIDFLITIHIFEKCQTLSPGDLTDLRSALVNNITLGALSVRFELYKFMLHYSSQLNDCMMRFVKHQQNRNHIIDDDILFLVEENEVNIAEAVDVPKALGDIFEALIGAIYLDSGKDMKIVWNVLYNLMENEIETFCKDIPKNHVRMLYETNCGPKFISSLESSGAVMVTVEIMHKGVEKRFYGFGDNKKQAKRAAAKHALRFIRSNQN